jgi:ubiquinone/menaquinone biosynthesis C-methylase UbiE
MSSHPGYPSHPGHHALLPCPSHDEGARQTFVRDLRTHLAVEVFPGNRLAYAHRVEPAFHKHNKRTPKDRHEIRKAMAHDSYYQMWSAMQRNSQELMWDSVVDTVERALPDLIATPQPGNAKGSLTLDVDLSMPDYLTSYDIHLQPGGYHSEVCAQDIAAGAVYDGGLPIYAMDSLGPLNDDLGWTTVECYQEHFPGRKPARVLDLGCSVGHSTLPWSEAFPDADVHAIDVGAPLLRYGHGRAEALGRSAHFSQQNAEQTNFEPGSFDVIVSHFFMHETSRKALPRVFAECRRLLSPGGVMLHLDLEQDRDLDPLTSFLMEWEVYNNNESFMGQLRSLDLEALAVEAGFAEAKVKRIQQPSRASSDQTGDGYVNFFTWPILTASV